MMLKVFKVTGNRLLLLADIANLCP
jgi:hypothetical protein